MSEEKAAATNPEDYERISRSLEVNDNMNAEIEALKAEGWELIPGVPPVTVYHLVRLKNRPEPDFQVRMSVDDTKIGVLRDGKLVQE